MQKDILLIEPDPGLRLRLKHFLSFAKFRLIVGASLSQAVARLDDSAPEVDLVICSLLCCRPEEISAMEARLGHPPVIVLGESSEDSEVEWSVIEYPFPPERVVRMAKNLLNQRTSEVQLSA